ncbi:MULTISPECIES: sulfur carrier protein ThiS [Shewanella]|uniref:Sulfur carrier protein ThiS n=2 Tax=Shewanella TaxID=22 RepID=A0AAJ1BGM5_9GAMM|nr:MULTISPECIES: sulfur carrier protein ThiS [Shewanella]AZQ10656.1 Sulfur carrier protein ThiS [Shewanella khirikhana]MCH4294346.1 sulfur carrier protein ThiS [Shewanella zhuhaiensis]QYJ73665.1 sulfur carrier protein ThiS [Shewanella sp. FJAT-52076]
MLSISVNGQSHPIDDGQDLASLVKHHCERDSHIALVLNGEVVPRHRWEHIHLKHNDAVELFAAVAGG